MDGILFEDNYIPIQRRTGFIQSIISQCLYFIHMCVDNLKKKILRIEN